eukprot:m.54865 g.54865  ORF g.54865 m.54865 type:complete len:165 (-) comp11455_c0_seq1:425-919(-)
MAHLPIVKIGVLTIKTIAKPISKIIKKQARNHERIRNHIVMPIGQVSHWASTRLQRITLNSSRRDVKPLDMEAAIESGSEFMGELFIWSVAMGLLISEYMYSAKKSAAKEQKLQDRLTSLTETNILLADRVLQLEDTMLQLQAQINKSAPTTNDTTNDTKPKSS